MAVFKQPKVAKEQPKRYISGMDTELNKVLEIVGGQAKLAKHLLVSDNAVSKWVARGYPPPGRVLQIYELVEGQLTPEGASVDLRKLLQDASDG